MEALDGEPLVGFDREMAREYFAQEARDARRGSGLDAARSKVAGADPERVPLKTKNEEAFDWNELPKGRPKLFGAASLDGASDRVAVDYLARHVLENPLQGPALRDETWRPDDAI